MILVTLIVACLSICGCTGVPQFVDKTEGDCCSLLYGYEYPFEKYTAERYPFSKGYWQNDLLQSPEMEELGEITEEEMAEAAAWALMEHYGEQYIDAGKYPGASQGHIVLSTADDSAWIYYGGQTAVVISKERGIVMACLDTRIQPAYRLQLNRGGSDGQYLVGTCYKDISRYTREELKKLYSRSAFSFHTPYYDSNTVRMPLEAAGAFHLAEQTGRNLGPGRMAQTAGDYEVYYCEASDSYAVITGSFVEMIAREDGSLLFLEDYRTMKLDVRNGR